MLSQPVHVPQHFTGEVERQTGKRDAYWSDEGHHGKMKLSDISLEILTISRMVLLDAALSLKLELKVMLFGLSIVPGPRIVP